MPDRIASHWGFEGRANGYSSKFWGLFLMPILSLGLYLFFLLIPKIDPLRDNIKQFKKYFDGFVLAFVSFLFYTYILTIFWNTGFVFDMGRFLLPGLGILFFYIGVLMENSKKNWFIGIRTPWTLSSERVWEKTNKLGGKLFKIAGIVALFGILFPDIAAFFVIIPVILASIYLVLYSYLDYQKEIRN
jgi:uncharacterized membrane protein